MTDIEWHLRRHNINSNNNLFYWFLSLVFWSRCCWHEYVCTRCHLTVAARLPLLPLARPLFSPVSLGLNALFSSQLLTSPQCKLCFRRPQFFVFFVFFGKKSSANSLPSADKNDSRFYPLHPVAVYSVLVFGTSQKCFFTTPFGSNAFYCSLVASPCCLLGFPEVFLISIFGVQSHSKLCSSCVFGTTGALWPSLILLCWESCFWRPPRCEKSLRGQGSAFAHAGYASYALSALLVCSHTQKLVLYAFLVLLLRRDPHTFSCVVFFAF